VGGVYRLSFFVTQEDAGTSYGTIPGVTGLKISGYPEQYLEVPGGDTANGRYYTLEFIATQSATAIEIVNYGHISPFGSVQDSQPVSAEGIWDDVILNQCGYSVSGRVFYDINGLTDNTVADSGIGSNAGSSTLTAYLVDSNGQIVSSTNVPASGFYSFDNLNGGLNFKVVLSNVPGTTGAATGISTALPLGWVNTGEVDTNGTLNDGNPNGVTALFDLVSSNVVNRNFGIQQGPSALGVNVPPQQNPGGLVAVSVPVGNFGASDPAPGAIVSYTFTGPFPSNATTIVINGTSYHSGNWGSGVTVTSLTSVTVDPAPGAVIVSLPYRVSDAAGLTASSAVDLSFTTGQALSGNVFNDTNGLNDIGGGVVNGSGTNAGSSNLTAYLVSAGLIVASSPISPGGAYSFSDLANGIYTVVLSNQPGLTGSAAAITTTLPLGWVNVGEQIGTLANGSDGTIDGKSASITLSGTSVSNVNFGIEQAPTAVGANLAPQPNPNNTVSVSIPIASFGGSDVGPGTVASYQFDPVFPAGVTTLTINNIPYNLGNWPMGGLNVTAITSVSVDPADGNVTVTIPFKVIDNAGVKSPLSANVTVPFLAYPDMVSKIGILPTGVAAGNTITLPVTFNNIGGAPGLNAVPTLQLRPNLVGVMPSNGGIYNAMTGLVTWPTIASFPTNSPVSYSVGLTMPSGRLTAQSGITATNEINTTLSNNLDSGAIDNPATDVPVNGLGFLLLLILALFVLVRQYKASQKH
jgi:hypothetical protein